MSIYIWKPVVVSDMQWPCKEGFHVPLQSEWAWLYTMWNTMWLWTTSNWTNMEKYLKLPYIWIRKSTDSTTSDQWTNARYWSSSPYTNTTHAYVLYLASNGINTTAAVYRNYWCGIRAFSDVAVQPDDTRTVLYQWTGNAGVYHNTTLWIISISSDWNTWITIADKNEWATTVYNNWDTLSEANCWKYYQRWNNYWFAWTWSITTSSSQVNASTYWPLNYYNSSTFIYRSSSPYWWDSSWNNNLRWWTSQWTSTINKEVKNIYVWVDEELPYLCFTSGYSNSQVTLSKNWSPTAVTLETSTDCEIWSPYTIWSTITLTSGNKVYFRNTSETDTWFSTSTTNYYRFTMSGIIYASWDVNFLLNKNSTATVSTYCFCNLFNWCGAMITPPRLTATTIWAYCYRGMFNWCASLNTLPELPATTLYDQCYQWMFQSCSSIKLSTSQTWEYQTEYRIPTAWTWTAWTNSLNNMFNQTWWTFTWTPSINTTYYTSNTVV